LSREGVGGLPSKNTQTLCKLFTSLKVSRITG